MARGRPATPLGTHGAVSEPEQVATNSYLVRTYLRLYTGQTVQVKAHGASPTAAHRNLERRCAQRLVGGAIETLTITSKLSELMKLWLEQHDVAETSRNTYQKCLKLHINPNIGDLRLNELTTQRLQVFLNSLTPGTAKTARAALSSACGMAVRWGVFTINPVRETKLKKRKRRPVRALSEDEIQAYRNAIERWCGSNTMGTKRGDCLLEIVDVLRGSGMRIGEVLGLVWSDIDFINGTVTISGQVDNKGGRKDFPKTESSRRTIHVKRCALDALERQWNKDYRPFMGEIVFPTRNGTFKTVPNVSGDLKKARGELDIHAHDFRKTVATRIEGEHGLLAASRYLGHASTRVTEQSYVARPGVLPDFTDSF